MFKMNFNKHNYHEMLVSSLFRQREAVQFCDIILIVQGHKFPAHRSILAASSKYFLSVLTTNRVIKEKVTMQNCKNLNAFKTILDYMYTGAIIIEWENVVELMSLSFKFQLDDLMGYCETYLKDNINSSSCFTIQKLALKFHLQHLQKAVTEFIRTHLVEVLEQEDILKFTKHKFVTFFKENKFNLPQQDLLDIFCKWIERDEEKRELCFAMLLTMINWDGVNLAFLEENIGNCSLLKKNRKCLFILLNLLNIYNIKLTVHEKMFASLQTEFSNQSVVDIQEPVDSELIQECSHVSKNIRADASNVSQSSGNQEVKLNNLKCKRSRKSKNPQKIELLFINTDNEKKDKSSQHSLKNKSLCPKKSKPEEGNQLKIDAEEDSSVDEPPAASNECSVEDHSNPYIKYKEEFKCLKCCFTAHSSRGLEQHITRSHAIDGTFNCTDCDFTCTYIPEFIKHLKTHYDNPPYSCHVCKYSTNSIHTFSTHIFKHTDQRPYVCEICNHRCTSQNLIKQHIKIQHTGDKPFACDQCKRRFATKRLVYQHSFSHRTDKSFLCDTCGFRSKYKKDLTVHKRIHTGDAYRCKHPNCTFSTFYKNRLKSHGRVHTKDRPYICSFCGCRFADRSYLTKHENTHLNLAPFKCEQCQFSSVRKEKLKDHLRRHHSKDSTCKKSFQARKKKILRVTDEQAENEVTDALAISAIMDVASYKAKVKEKASICGTDDSNNKKGILVCLNPSRGNEQEEKLNKAARDSQVTSQSHQPIPAISHETPTKFRSFMSFL